MTGPLVFGVLVSALVVGYWLGRVQPVQRGGGPVHPSAGGGWLMGHTLPPLPSTAPWWVREPARVADLCDQLDLDAALTRTERAHLAAAARRILTRLEGPHTP